MRHVSRGVFTIVLILALSGCGEGATGYSVTSPSEVAVVQSRASHAAVTTQSQAVLRPTDDPMGQAALSAVQPSGEVAAPVQQQPAEPEPLVPTAFVLKTANIRDYPSTTHGAVLTTVAEGAEVLLLSKIPDGTWYEVLTPNGRGGYISASLISISKEVFAEVEVEPAPPRPARPATRPKPPAQPARPAANCEPSYPDICIPVGAADLDCPDMSTRRFRVVGSDPHRFDGDGDGIGCE